MSSPQTLEEFVNRFGGKDNYPTIDLEPEPTQWPSFVVRYGEHAAIVQFMGVGEGEGAHLCIDVHPFVGGVKARAGVFGMEVGRRLEGFADSDAAGTSHGFPAAALVAVLVGKQT